MKLLVIGYYYSPNNSLINFKNLVEKFNIDYILIKLKTTNKFDELLNTIFQSCKSIICIVNISEVFLCANMQEILDKFINYNSKIVFPSQPIMENGIDLKTYWNNEKLNQKKKNILRNFKDRKDFKIPRHKYLNISGFIGEKEYVIKYLEFIKNNSIYEEQKMGGYFIELNNHKCKLDYECKIFGTICGLTSFKNNDMIYFKFKKGRVVNIRNLEKPSVLCFPNSGQDLNLRMYKYGNLILKKLYHHDINYINLLTTTVSFLPMVFINKITINYILILTTVLLFFIYYFFCLYL